MNQQIFKKNKPKPLIQQSTKTPTSTMKITYKPLKSLYDPKGLDLHKTYHLLVKEPQEVIPVLEDCLQKNPNNPLAITWLCAAYESLDQKDKARELLEENVQLYPQYIYNLTRLSKIYLEEGAHEKVPPLFKNTWNLKELFPDRNVFHIGEVIAFLQVCCDYFYQAGKKEEANNYLTMLKEVHPKKDHQLIQDLEKKLAT